MTLQNPHHQHHHHHQPTTQPHLFQRLTLTYLISMSKPQHAPLPPPHQQYPLLATPTQPLPSRSRPLPSPSPITALHASRLRRRVESGARDGADAVRETLIVPEGAVFEDEPATGVAKTAPAFALGAVVADVEGSVEVVWEAGILGARGEGCCADGGGWGGERQGEEDGVEGGGLGVGGFGGGVVGGGRG